MSIRREISQGAGLGEDRSRNDGMFLNIVQFPVTVERLTERIPTIQLYELRIVPEIYPEIMAPCHYLGFCIHLDFISVSVWANRRRVVFLLINAIIA
jgi:hypothetical protein